MAPIGFLQLLLEKGHLFFRCKLVPGGWFDHRRKRSGGRIGTVCPGAIVGYTRRRDGIIHDARRLVEPPAFFQFTYISSVFERAHGVRRRNVRLDLTLGS